MLLDLAANISAPGIGSLGPIDRPLIGGSKSNSR